MIKWSIFVLAKKKEYKIKTRTLSTIIEIHIITYNIMNFIEHFSSNLSMSNILFFFLKKSNES